VFRDQETVVAESKIHWLEIVAVVHKMRYLNSSNS